jgi:spermidine/putrescine-binding protein
MLLLPEGYHHKATSESFNGADKVSIHHSSVTNQYSIYVHANQEEEYKVINVSKAQLELIVHAGTDVLDMDK